MPESVSRGDFEAAWTSARSDVAAKLGRLRLGVEPIEEQLARYRRVTWVLTAIPLALSVFIIILFTVQGRLDVGIVLSAVLLLPSCWEHGSITPCSSAVPEPTCVSMQTTLPSGRSAPRTSPKKAGPGTRVTEFRGH